LWPTKPPQSLLGSKLVLEKQLHLLTDHLPVFCISLSEFRNESATRAVSKICMFLSLNSNHLPRTTITESCFEAD
jgi:hypothetical protein